MTPTGTAAAPDAPATNGQLTDPTLTAEVAAPKTPRGVELRTPHDYALVRSALEERKEGLAKLAKRNEDDGYHREAKTIKADAEAIEFSILPQFSQQTTLPLVTQGQLEEKVRGAIRVHLHRAFEILDQPKHEISPEGVRRRRDDLSKLLAEKIAAALVDCAEAAWKQGYAFREATPEKIASEQLDALRAS